MTIQGYTWEEMAATYEAGSEAVAITSKLVSISYAEKIAGLMIILGLLFGVMLPYIIKIYQDEAIRFDYQYFKGAILAGILAFLVFAGQSIPEGTSVLVFALKAFLVGATVDIAINDLITTDPVTKNNSGIKRIDKDGIH